MLIAETNYNVSTFFFLKSWHYLTVGEDGGQLPGGGTYLTYMSPDRKNFSIVLETMTLKVGVDVSLETCSTHFP